MFYIVSYLVAFTIATRIGLSLGIQGLQIRYVDQINYSSLYVIHAFTSIRSACCAGRCLMRRTHGRIRRPTALDKSRDS